MDIQNYPAEIETERKFVGGLLYGDSGIGKVRDLVTPEDIYTDSLRDLVREIYEMYDNGLTVGPETVAMKVRQPSKAMLELQADGAFTTQLTTVAQHIRELSTRRRLLKLGIEISECAYDRQLPLGKIIENLNNDIGGITLPELSATPGPYLDDFLKETETIEWLIPEFLTRQTRVLLSGWLEGGGKSTILRQIAIQCAAGLMPFQPWRDIKPAKVLLIDAEVPSQILRNDMRRMRKLLPDDCAYTPDNFVIISKPAGLDLLRPKDQSWLSATIKVNAPDILVIGPVYKLHEGDPIDERDAKTVAMFFDRLRVRHNFALLMETHTPNETSKSGQRALRPFGASLWRRWPEIGVGLTSDDHGNITLEEWRYSRGGRGAWPRYFRRGLEEMNEWPWVTEID